MEIWILHNIEVVDDRTGTVRAVCRPEEFIMAATRLVPKGHAYASSSYTRGARPTWNLATIDEDGEFHPEWDGGPIQKVLL